ncbi:TrkA C-terminal domain-containing protein [Paraferrimonas sedimenticola]|uniref:Transporter n=1 Tax=Paraferrimonas sedimenticola TaxID=375674 RepID=A0AA37RUY0_9GAMM|nr:TrkA C-terminal domain-containing protein [Paraferrimonas sedimenticola]GLP96065.1 putative transporter [Paraferrimonas sedimenticola]
MNFIIEYMQTNVVLVLFLVLGLGHLLGKVKIGSLELGSTTGILAVGLVVGLIHIDVPPIVKGLSFTLYLFSLGVMMGPAFIHLLFSRQAFKYLAVSLFAGVAMAVSLYFVAVVFDLNSATVGGVAAGAMTTSAILAAAQDALSNGSIPLSEGMSVSDAGAMLGGAYALTYLFGTFGLIIILKLLPKIVGKDIAVEAAKLDTSDSSTILDTTRAHASLRAWKITAPDFIGKSIKDLEDAAEHSRDEEGVPTLVEKVIRNGDTLALNANLVLQKGDIICIWATPSILVKGNRLLGEEVTDNKLLDIQTESAELVLTNKALVGKSLRELVTKAGRGVTVERMVRTGNDLPVRGDTTLVAGDVLFVSGPQSHVAEFSKSLGYKVKDQLSTDFVSFGLFVAAFGVIGTISINLAGINLAILGGASMGAMIGGAVLGWLRSRSPMFGSVAAPATDAISTLCLGIFIAAVALGAGGSLLELIQSQGPVLIIAGMIVTTFCAIAIFLFGHFVLQLNVALNVGATYGAMTGTAINEFVKDAKSSAPAVAFALPGALCNVVFIAVALVVMAIV